MGANKVMMKIETGNLGMTTLGGSERWNGVGKPATLEPNTFS
jgi:hypothetical protein